MNLADVTEVIAHAIDRGTLSFHPFDEEGNETFDRNAGTILIHQHGVHQQEHWTITITRADDEACGK